MKLQVKTLSSLFLVAAVAFLSACGGSSSSSTTEKTVTGKALKADGSVVAQGTTVTAVDQNGNAAEGTVDANGNFSLKLVSVSSSGKKGRNTDVPGFLYVDGLYTVIPSDGDKANVNAITAAAAAVAIGSFDIDAMIAKAVEALGAGKTEITDATTLANLANVKSITKELFKSTTTQVVNSLFGVDSTGEAAIDAERFLTGEFKSTDKATVLLVAAAKAKGDLISAAVSAANGAATTPMLNDSSFIQAVGDELGKVGGKASDFINDVVKSSAVKDSLKTIEEALQTYVNAVVKALAENTTVSDTAFAEAVTTIPTSSAAPAQVSISASRSGDTITYAVTGAETGDVNVATMVISDASTKKIKATVTVALAYSSAGIVPSSANAIVVSTETVSVTITNVTSIVSSTGVDLAKALAAAKSSLDGAGQTDLAAKVPATSVGLSVNLSGTAVKRSGKEIKTLITSGTTSVNSVQGVNLN